MHLCVDWARDPEHWNPKVNSMLNYWAYDEGVEPALQAALVGFDTP